MSKIYYEMNDKEKQLHHIADNLDYAICMLGIGLSGTGEYNIPNRKVYELEKKIVNHLIEVCGDVEKLLKAVEEKDDYLPKEEETDGQTPEEEQSMILHKVENVKDLGVLNNYQMEYMIESENEHKEKGVSILFKKKVEDGEYVYRQLLFNGNGKQYISDEF